MRLPATPPPLTDVLQRIFSDRAKTRAANEGIAQALRRPYEHWDRVRFWPPIAPLTREEMWGIVKWSRMSNQRGLPFTDKTGRQFSFVQTGNFLRALHEIDGDARGGIAVTAHAARSDGRDVYLQRSLVEEPFSSSVLEGAATTREVAKRLIEEGKTPKNIDERMVLNNYHAMEFIRDHRNDPLTVERILETHRILTEGTLERPEKCGVFRAPADDVRVVDSLSDETLHIPPPAAQLAERVSRLCEFANEVPSKGDFLHPLIRAIVLHFMLAYDHPFWDGNGRCARALFYWCVLRHGYWLLEYVSISAVIRRSARQYGRAFLYTETDDGDVTYFIDHQLRVIQKAIIELHVYLDAKSKELRDLAKAFGKLETEFNRRQLQIVQDSLKRPNAKYEIAAHERTHSVSYLTARSDLENLAAKGFLKKTKEGVKSVYSVSKNLRNRLGALST
jgi:Fic family protein